MYHQDLNTLICILDESPFFEELSLRDRESLLKELLSSYPQLIHPDHYCALEISGVEKHRTKQRSISDNGAPVRVKNSRD